MSNLQLKLVSQYEPMTDLQFMALLASDGEREIFIKLTSEHDGRYKQSDVSAMLRLFADQIDRKFGETKEAA